MTPTASLTTYKVTCLKCKHSDEAIIEDTKHLVVDWGGKVTTNFLAARWRGDETWGFECACGNDNRVSASEKDQLGSLITKGDVVSVQKIADSLKVADKTQFTMERK